MAKETVYKMIWRNKWLTADADTVPQMLECYQWAIDEVKKMQEDGLEFDFGGGPDDYISILTTDAALAEKYGMCQMDFDDEEGDDEEGDDDCDEEGGEEDGLDSGEAVVEPIH